MMVQTFVKSALPNFARFHSALCNFWNYDIWLQFNGCQTRVCLLRSERRNMGRWPASHSHTLFRLQCSSLVVKWSNRSRNHRLTNCT